MEMNQVRYFVALCETLNFTKAAEACGVAQPSLTKAIQKLEEELGGPLFVRERTLTHLSDLGRLMRPHLEAVFHASESAKLEARSFGKLERGRVRLGVMCTIGPTRLVGFLKRFRAALPSVEVALRDAPGREVLALLMEGELDCALLGLPDLPERVEVQPLYRERYTVAFAPGHRFEAMDVVPLAELDQEDYLNRVNCEYPQHFNSLGIPDPADVRVCYESEREDWIQAMILAGLGCAVMPEFLPMLPGIATRPLIEPELSRTVSLASVAGRRHSPALREFMALARRYDWGGTAQTAAA
ncbi:LysR family transcriptional regulator [Nitrospirillum amazonense]|uniref:LysR family transcriptional regulator n=1 Tax=Nitrospirillum amazonense TaxID=28077 RepID=A0A560FT88_9PROT|nr:LysR family transcriptional regulator [Nitrospirillum amazonense]TWB24792.1 LysR family transcriptional regulator [Nitrospirillum amazonense]